MIPISGGKSALWWEQKRQMRGGKSDKLGGGKSDKGKWNTAIFLTISQNRPCSWGLHYYGIILWYIRIC